MQLACGDLTLSQTQLLSDPVILMRDESQSNATSILDAMQPTEISWYLEVHDLVQNDRRLTSHEMVQEAVIHISCEVILTKDLGMKWVQPNLFHNC